ncbi:MAG: methylated-DNA--[protein]-cysteine S-methyltransferase [Eubacteriales bacterium]
MKQSPETFYRSSPVGILGISCLDDKVVSIRFMPEGQDCNLTGQSELADIVVGQLIEYLSGQRRDFDIPVSATGTKFQHGVWELLSRIPFGEVRSYGEIARALGSPKAARAVGMACNRNPLPIIVPCHRVVGSDGSLTGYAGGIALKKKLLELEGVSI